MTDYRSPSTSSTDPGNHDENYTPHMSSADSSFVKLNGNEDLEMAPMGAAERQQLIEEKAPEEPPQAPPSARSAVIWMVVNTLSTIGIVFTNKAIFSDASLKLAQLTFAAFHFFITWLTLFTLSRPRFAMFTPRRVAVKEILPLSIAMALNVILPNYSLAFSSVTFYQVVRIMLTPTVAIVNYFLYGATLPRQAILALIPACVGVFMVTYSDTQPSADAAVKTTSSAGVIFAFCGIMASALYTVWIASYHKKLQMNSMQLLFNQAPVSAFMLLYLIPFLDTLPIWTEVPGQRWLMIMMSGGFAALINMSQFFIIASTGPVSSTVVGHLKTCSIVTIGWITGGRGAGDKGIIGVLIAIGGIISYSVVMIKEKTKNPTSRSASS